MFLIGHSRPPPTSNKSQSIKLQYYRSCLVMEQAINQSACLFTKFQPISVNKNRGKVEPEFNKSTFIWFCLLSLVNKIQIRPINGENISPLLSPYSSNLSNLTTFGPIKCLKYKYFSIPRYIFYTHQKFISGVIRPQSHDCPISLHCILFCLRHLVLR